MNIDFKKYVDSTKFINHKIFVSPQKIIINTLPNNINLIIDYAFTIIVILLINKFWLTDILTLIILAACAIISLWIDFNSVTELNINLEKNIISVCPKNIIQRFFSSQKGTLKLSEANLFYIQQKTGYRYFTRYRIYLKLNDNSTLLITDLGEEKQANDLIHYLNLIIK
jgi:hypothetical protein